MILCLIQKESRLSRHFLYHSIRLLGLLHCPLFGDHRCDF